MKTRIIVVDDQAMMRTAVRFVLEHRIDLEVVGEASNGNEALNLIEQITPDVVIMDIHLPDLTGIEVTQKIFQLSPATKVIILTGDDDDYFLEEGLHIGIAGYLLKGCAGVDLEKAIDTVMQGDVYVGISMVDHSQIKVRKSNQIEHHLFH